MWPVVGNRLDVLERPPRRSLGDLFRPVDSHRRMHDDQNVFGVDGSAFVPSSVDDLSPDFIRRPQNFASDAGAGKQGHTCVAVMVAALIDCQLAGCAPEFSPCDDQGFVDQLPTVFICFRLQITEQIRKSRIQLRA